MRTRSVAAAGLILAVALGAAGCKKGSGLPGVGGGSGGDDAKLNAYVTAYNGIMDESLGLPGDVKQYVEERIAQASPSDNIVLYPDYVADKMKGLKDARAMAGGPPELDAAGDRLIAALDKVVTRYDSLKQYYDSKKYADDKLARGKAEDAAMKAEFQAGLDATEGLGKAIADVHDSRRAKQMADLKSRGDMVGYDMVASMQKARALVDLFDDPKTLHEEAVFAQADRLVGELEPLLDDERKRLAAAPHDPNGHDRNSYFSGAVDELTKMLGAYRDTKRTREDNNRGYMVTYFNNAIGQMNSAS